MLQREQTGPALATRLSLSHCLVPQPSSTWPGHGCHFPAGCGPMEHMALICFLFCFATSEQGGESHKPNSGICQSGPHGNGAMTWSEFRASLSNDRATKDEGDSTLGSLQPSTQAMSHQGLPELILSSWKRPEPQLKIRSQQ